MKNLVINSCESRELIGENCHGLFYLIQKERFGRYSQDAILLAYYCANTIKPSDTILEIGSGTGIIPVSLSYQNIAFKKLIAVEKNSVMAELAQRNFKNLPLAFSCRIQCIADDIANYMVEPEKFDIIISNPPYFKINSGKLPENGIQQEARYEISLTLESLLTYCIRAMKVNSRCYLVYRLDRIKEFEALCENFSLCFQNFTEIITKKNTPAKLFLVTLVLGKFESAYSKQKLDVSEGLNYGKLV